MCSSRFWTYINCFSLPGHAPEDCICQREEPHRGEARSSTRFWSQNAKYISCIDFLVSLWQGICSCLQGAFGAISQGLHVNTDKLPRLTVIKFLQLEETWHMHGWTCHSTNCNTWHLEAHWKIFKPWSCQITNVYNTCRLLSTEHTYLESVWNCCFKILVGWYVSFILSSSAVSHVKLGMCSWEDFNA